MSHNSFGKLFKVTTWGESHGTAIGCVIDGCPPLISLTEKDIQKYLDLRKPGTSKFVTQRKEDDKVEFLSGIFEGITTGTPIGFVIKNSNQKSKDYDHIKNIYRPSHADFTYEKKYGLRDYRGGGRSSARETVCRVVAGAIAKQLISDIKITAYTSSVGEIKLNKHYSELDFSNIENNSIRCPEDTTAQSMIEKIKEIKKNGDTIGGVITCVVKNVPIGIGEPVFNKLHAKLGSAMLSINAVKGFEFGSGFNGTLLKGSEHNDLFNEDNTTETNHSGGIQGGISNGMDIYFNIAFKPVATIMQKQTTINSDSKEVTMMGKGRHDPCVLPRAIPIVESMAALVIADFVLLARLNKL